MKCFNGLLISLMFLPALSVAATQEIPAIKPGPASDTQEKKASSQPLPESPIPVPALSANASKAELVAAYFDVTGARMFDVLMKQFVKPPASMEMRTAGCPVAKDFLETQVTQQVAPHFRGWLDNTIKPRIITILDEGLSETDLRAFLRFAATPDGQRHLNQIATQKGNGDISLLPAYLEDADLRSYHAHLKVLDGRVEEVFGDAKNELITPEFMQRGRKMAEDFADLIAKCEAADKS